jgi:phosphate:Na+ symporter
MGCLIYGLTFFLFWKNEPVLALAMFHTLFNVVGILIFAPFILPYTQVIEKIVKVTPTNIERHVQKLDAEVPEGAVGSFGIELQRLHRLVIHYNTGVWSVDANLIVQLEPEDIEIVGETKPGSEAQYNLIRQLYENLLAYSVRLLSAQRSYYQSCRQAANAIREYLLSKTITETH